MNYDKCSAAAVVVEKDNSIFIARVFRTKRPKIAADLFKIWSGKEKTRALQAWRYTSRIFAAAFADGNPLRNLATGFLPLTVS